MPPSSPHAGLYGQMAKSRGVKGKAEKVSEKDFQKDLQYLVDDLSEASDKLQGKAKKKSHKARNRVSCSPVSCSAFSTTRGLASQTREWIMERIAGGDGDGLEELEAELEAQADSAAGDNGAEP